MNTTTDSPRFNSGAGLASFEDALRDGFDMMDEEYGARAVSVSLASDAFGRVGFSIPGDTRYLLDTELFDTTTEEM
jgi:hypothetical protein